MVKLPNSWLLGEYRVVLMLNLPIPPLFWIATWHKTNTGIAWTQTNHFHLIVGSWRTKWKGVKWLRLLRNVTDVVGWPMLDVTVAHKLLGWEIARESWFLLQGFKSQHCQQQGINIELMLRLGSLHLCFLYNHIVYYPVITLMDV